MSREAEVASAYARLVLQSGVVRPAQLLRGLDLTEQSVASAEFVRAADLSGLFRNYDRHIKDPTWPVQLGAQLNIAAHGPLGFAALSAPTLGEALDVMANLQPVRNTALTTHVSSTATHYVMELRDAVDDALFYHWMVEVVLKIVETLLSSILGHPVGKNVVIRLRRPVPDYADAMSACYDSVVLFGQQANSIEVPLAWRALPSPLYNEAVYRANLIRCREMIAAREQADSLALAVRSRLSNHFDSQGMPDVTPVPPPTLEQMADTFHMASRTMIRRLQREDTSYKAMLEEMRKTHAGRLLRDARLTAAEVGERLGYREAANFGRAFRRWYGQSPSAWRRSGG